MLVISSREFRQHQKSYFEKVDEGGEILIRRGKDKSYKIVPVTEDDTLMTKEAFFAKIDEALEEARQGKVTKISSKEELDAFMSSL